MNWVRRGWRDGAQDEDGFVAIEFVLATGVLVVPTIILVLSLPMWIERVSLARVAAQEAARAVVLSSDATRGGQVGAALVAQTARNHDVEVTDVSVCYSVHDFGHGAPLGCTGLSALPRGAGITAAVTIRLPMLRLPFLPRELGALPPYTARHTERVDLYRSF